MSDSDQDWEAAIVDCFGEIPQGVDKIGWFKHQICELRGRLEWTEKSLEARKGSDNEARLLIEQLTSGKDIGANDG